MKKLSKENLIKQFQVVIDTREQLPYRFKNSITMGLPTGDYTIKYGNRIYADKIICERKSRVGELYAATGKDRERWERELTRLSKIEFRFILLEFSFMDIVNKQPPGILEASSVYGSIASWYVQFNVPFVFCENRNNARAYMYKVFYEYVKHRILE